MPNRTPPATLHHYTDAAGLLGIVASRTIWATDCRFLNDSQEYTPGLQLVTKALATMSNPALDPLHHLHHSADEAGRDYEVLAGIVINELTNNDAAFVACFCEDGDLLSQWRGYARRHGYSIEFDLATLNNALSTYTTEGPPAEVIRVEYDPNSAQQRARDAVATVAAGSLSHPGVHGHYIALQLAVGVATIKDRAFAEEREWRAVAIDYRAAGFGSLSDVQYRATPLAIVPFVALPVDVSAIVGIRVGPHPEAELRADGIRRWLLTIGLDVPVATSSVPFRS